MWNIFSYLLNCLYIYCLNTPHTIGFLSCIRQWYVKWWRSQHSSLNKNIFSTKHAKLCFIVNFCCCFSSKIKLLEHILASVGTVENKSWWCTQWLSTLTCNPRILYLEMVRVGFMGSPGFVCICWSVAEHTQAFLCSWQEHGSVKYRLCFINNWSLWWVTSVFGVRKP